MSTQIINAMTQTWNAGGTTFTAVKMNVTDTASAADSNLIDMQIGSTSQFKVGKADVSGATAGTQTQIVMRNRADGFNNAIKSLSTGGATFELGFGGVGSNASQFALSGGFSAFLLGSDKSIGWTSAGVENIGPDTKLSRSSAGIIIANSGLSTNTGIVPGVQFATTQVVTTLANSNAAQNVFAAANDVLSLAASTTYFFECLYYLDTGATTHTTATGFVASSAFTSINYWSELWSTTAGTISTTAPSVLNVAASTATVLNATSTATRTTIRCSGVIRTNSASTVTPQITFSADPTGTCTVAVNSYFRIWPVGSNTVAAVGNWA